MTAQSNKGFGLLFEMGCGLGQDVNGHHDNGLPFC